MWKRIFYESGRTVFFRTSVTDLTLESFSQRRFLMKQHVGYGYTEIDTMYPYEFDVEYWMVMQTLQNG